MDALVTASGISLDLSYGVPVPLNKAIADFREPDKRQRSFSKEIDLPGTALNQSFFASAFSLTKIGGAFDYNSSAKVNCVYYKNGATVLRNAVIKLNKVVVLDGKPIFKVTLFADFVDIFLILSTVDLRELDWSAYNHTLNNTNIQASWSTPIGTGYYYPLIERNQRPGIAQWRNTDMVPYVHLVDVFKKCMAYAGQKYTSTFLNSDTAKSILFGYGGGVYVDAAVSASEQNDRKVTTNNGTMTLDIDVSLGLTPVTSFVTNYPSIPFSGNMTLTEIQDVYGQLVGVKFTAARTGKYSLALIGSFRFEYVTANATYSSGGNRTLSFSKNGTLYTIATLAQTSADQTFALNTATDIELQQGDEVELFLSEASTSFNVTGTLPSVQLNITTPTPFQVNYTCLDTTLVEGSLVEIGRFLPSMKASDFVIGVIRLFKLMISDPDIYGNVRIEPEVSFYQGTNVFTDITEEVDHSKEIEIRPSANEYAKTLSYMFKTGTETDAKAYLDKWKEGYGNYSFDQPSFFAKGEQKIELPFATIIPYQVTPQLIVPRFVDVDVNGLKKTTAGVPRIMFRNGLKPGDWQLNGSSTSKLLTSYPAVHHFDDFEAPTIDLNWKLVNELMYTTNVVTTANTYSTYYAAFVNEIISKEGKYVQLYRKLNNVQVENIDWSRLLMWDGALFRFSKVVDFDSEISEVTKIEMIKVLEAKSTNRRQLLSATKKLSGVFTKIVGSVNDVGTGKPVIKGGLGNQTLKSNKVIRG